jgi:hypothetical protein
MVPEARKLRGRSTRFESSLEIPGFDDGNAGHMDGRLASEYVNIRHKVDPSRDERQALEDLNLLPDSLFTQVLKKGEYPAAHFIDDTCDGCVEAIVEGLGAGHRNFPAFSLITAPDFFPLADQFEVETDETIGRVEPLAKGRLPVNPTLPRPSNLNGFAFDRGETTMTAVVGGNASGPRATITGKVNRMVSFLPDAASNVFAPGWDTSQSFDALGQFLTSSGLGSPFPEDAKLCAALASFWPAVAPDNGRTFGNEKTFFNQLPMTDEELGFHPRHPVVVSGQVAAGTGWDGEFGPFFEQDAGKNHVNFADIRRSDYVSHALAGQVGAWATADIQSEDLIARHQALQKCEEILEARKREVFPDFFVPDVCLVVFRKVDNWADSVPGTPELAGSGFHLEFAEWSEDSTSKPTDDLTRVRREVHKVHVCQFSFHGVAYKNGANPFVFVP